MADSKASQAARISSALAGVTPAEIRVSFRRVISTAPYENETYEMGLTDTRLYPAEGPERLTAIRNDEALLLDQFAKAVDSVLTRRGRPQGLAKA